MYDGGSTSDRVLVRLCGGDAVPDIVSSHNTMLLEFHTSPYDNPFHPVPLSFLPGFELEVQVRLFENFSIRPFSFFLSLFLFPFFVFCLFFTFQRDLEIHRNRTNPTDRIKTQTKLNLSLYP